MYVIMRNSNPLKHFSINDLVLTECGREVCIPKKRIVNDPKSYHLIHYVTRGKGKLEVGGVVYHLSKGTLFYIGPNNQAKYSPDENDPWTYEWLGFCGNAADYLVSIIGLGSSSPIFRDDAQKTIRKILDELVNSYLENSEFDVFSLGLCYQILGIILREKKMQGYSYSHALSLVLITKNFIENNLQFDIKVSDIASNVGVSPNYLANVFASVDKTSPKQYLIKVRMARAEQLLATGKYRISEIAEMVGYKNQLYFSTEFKKTYKISPSKYAKGAVTQ